MRVGLDPLSIAVTPLLRSEVIIGVVSEKARPVIEDILGKLGYELVDLEYKQMYGDMHLIVYIASDHGITLDDCETVSNALDGPLDALDPTDSKSYCLDVSSPGLDRPFKTQRDFERNYGTEVEVKLYAPIKNTKRKQYVGTLVERTEQSLTLRDGEQTTVIENSLVASVRPYIEF